MSKALHRVKKSIRAALHARNWTERDLSRASGVNATTINNLLKIEDKDLTLSTLEALSKGLTISIADLIGERDEVSKREDLLKSVSELDDETAVVLLLILKLLLRQKRKV